MGPTGRELWHWLPVAKNSTLGSARCFSCPAARRTSCGVIPDECEVPALAGPRLVRLDVRRGGARARGCRVAQPDAGAADRGRRVRRPGGRVLVPCQPGSAAVDRAGPGGRGAGAHPGGVRASQPAVGRCRGGGADGGRGRDREGRAGHRRRGRGHARGPGGAPAAAVPDHEPEVGRGEGHEIRAEGQGRSAGRRGGAAGGPGDRGRGRAGPPGGGRWRRPARRGRGGRDPGAGGRHRRRARPAVPGDQRRDPQPLRAGPGAGPGGPRRLPGCAHRRGGTAR